MNDALSRLIEKVRPFVGFTYDGQEFYVRRTSSADNERLATTFTRTYDTKMRDFEDDDTVDSSSLRRSLLRQDEKDIAKYLVGIKETDIRQEVLELFDGDESINGSSPEVVDRVEAEKAKLLESYEAKSKEDLIFEALKHREHFLAFMKATQIRVQLTAALSIFSFENGEYRPVFNGVEEVALLGEDTLEGLMDAAGAALAPKAEDEVPNPLP